VDPHFQVLHAI